MDSQELREDFVQAVAQFTSALEVAPESDLIKAGCIQYFEFSFELAWKAIKRCAENEGIGDCNSPKAALKAAFSFGWIENEEIWLDMLMSRNRMSQTYSASSALTVYDQLPGYVTALQQLSIKLATL
jgi:nucleotidyltransferase substrate binding protein (TIGR01987 family)